MDGSCNLLQITQKRNSGTGLWNLASLGTIRIMFLTVT